MDHNSRHKERRRYRRYRARDGAFATLIPNERLGQIHDISKGGLSFCYLVEKRSPGPASEVNIVVAGTRFKLVRLPYRTVFDRELQRRFSFSPVRVRHMGLQFVALTPAQEDMLARFIRYHTTGRA
jgi:hypothetical protein